jgi:hypothetical protein
MYTDGLLKIKNSNTVKGEGWTPDGLYFRG